MTLWAIVLVVGASARLTRLGITDDITTPIRRAIVHLFMAKGHISTPASRWFAALFDCPWCFGFWVSFAVATAAHWGYGHIWFMIPAIALTCSYAVGLLARLEG